LAGLWTAIGRLKCVTSRWDQVKGVGGVPVRSVTEGTLEMRCSPGTVSYQWRETGQAAADNSPGVSLATENVQLFDGRHLYDENSVHGLVSVFRADVKDSANAAMNLPFPPVLVSRPFFRENSVTLDRDATVNGQSAFVIRRTLADSCPESSEAYPQSVLPTVELQYFSKANGALLRRVSLDADGTPDSATDFEAFEITTLCDDPPFVYEPREGVEIYDYG
jgi:hypothetical protein